MGRNVKKQNNKDNGVLKCLDTPAQNTAVNPSNHSHISVFFIVGSFMRLNRRHEISLENE